MADINDTQLNEIQLKAELLLGSDIDVAGITLLNHKLGKIIKDIKLDKYNHLATLSILEIKDLLEKRDNISEELLNISVFELSFLIPNIQDWFIEFLNTFTPYKWIANDKFQLYMALDEKLTINKDDMDLIFKVFRKMYWVERSSKSNTVFDPNKAVDEATRKLVEELAQKEQEIRNKHKKKKNITLNGIIAGVCVTSQNYSFFNIENLTMYQLMTAFYINDAHEHYNYIMTSAYVGMYDLSKTKVEDLHYCNEIDV